MVPIATASHVEAAIPGGFLETSIDDTLDVLRSCGLTESSRVLLVGNGLADAMCALLRHGFRDVATARLDAKVEAGSVDVVLALGIDSAEMGLLALRQARHALVPLGFACVVFTPAAANRARPALWRATPGQGLSRRDGFGSHLLVAELPLFGRLAA